MRLNVGRFPRSTTPDIPRLTALASVLSVAGVVAGAVALTLVPFGAPAAPSLVGHVDLSDISKGRGGFVIKGEYTEDFSGFVAGIRDLNGDGLADILVAAPRYGSYVDVGRAYVVFGKTTGARVELSDIAAGEGGFVIDGEVPFDVSGRGQCAGDVNGDGLADLILMTYQADRDGKVNVGRQYVVFGKSDTTRVQLSDITKGTGGFVIDGECSNDWSGYAVSSAGDVNGDGLSDLIIGAPGHASNNLSAAGRAYVVFGKADTAPVKLSAIAAGTGGFAISGHNAYDDTGHAVGAGDVNGDGLSDLVVSAWRADPGGRNNSGQAYVVFGKSDTAAVDLGDVEGGQGGFVMNGKDAEDGLGSAVSHAGDVNGDGLGDLLLGTNTYSRAFVVFGKSDGTAVEMSAVAAGAGGFVMSGSSDFDSLGGRLGGAGDVDADGLADLIVGVPSAGKAGRSYVVYGKTDTSAVDLLAIAAGAGGGFAIHGEDRGDDSGSTVGVADVNGDGLMDILVGAEFAGGYAGKAYVIFGSTRGAFKESEVDTLGGPAKDKLAGTSKSNVLVGGAGNDTLTGNGGADVLYGGSGDDVIVINASNVKALHAPFGVQGNSVHLARIDGGTGMDTLCLSGAGITLDLTRIPNQGGATPESTSRIESIERIDLTGSGDNTLVFSVKDVQDIVGMNLINSSTQAALGWTNGSFIFPARVRRHQLVIDGDAGDVVNLPQTPSGWLNVGTAFNDGVGYTVYDTGTLGPQFERVEVIVANAVTTNVPAVFSAFRYPVTRR